jgi:multidrug resistance efflux pump
MELLLCSVITILPDYPFRRYVQGKRIGREITLYSVWYELRWGITTCLILTVSLITIILYFHPSTQNVTALFRTVTILPEANGRVAEVYVKNNDEVEAGEPLFRLDSSQQEAARETARRRIAEVDASIAVATTELAGADGVIQQAQGAYRQAKDELDTKVELRRINPNAVASREIDRLKVAADAREDFSRRRRQARKRPWKQAQVDLDKTVIRAGVAGKVQQFVLRPGDVVNPLIRSAGVLVPNRADEVLIAGFNQLEAGIIKVGMIGEVACPAKVWTIIPVVVTQVQEVIAAGQVRGTDQLLDVQQVSQPGTITAYLEPLYAGQFDGIPPGSSCIANAYTSYEEQLATKDLSTLTRLSMHTVDTVAFVHAMVLRIQALLMPVTTLVFSGGH